MVDRQTFLQCLEFKLNDRTCCDAGVDAGAADGVGDGDAGVGE